MDLKVNLFDLDRTLIHKNLSFGFYFFLLQEGIVPLATLLRTIPLYFRHQFKSLSLENLHHIVFKHILKGQKLHILHEAADRFVAPFIEKTLNRVVFKQFLDAKNARQPTYLLSSSAHFLVERAAQLLGFDRCIGTQYSVDNEGRLCHISTLITGPVKLEIAKRWTDAGAYTTAYSDSSDDLPLLQWADKPIAVRPDKVLRAIARQNGWIILESQ